MDLSLPITYNGLSVNSAVRTSGGGPMSGYLVDEVTTSEVEIAAYFEKRAINDGIDASDVYLGRRRIGMIVTVFGSSKGDFWDKAQDLLSAFSPTVALAADTANLGFLPLDFYQPTADIVTWPLASYPNGIPLRYYVRPAALPTFEIKRDEDGGVSGKGTSKKFRVSLVAKDPRKVSQSLSTSTSSTTWTTLGDYPASPYVFINATTATGTWIGTMNGSAWTVNVDGSKLTSAQASSANHWVIDSVNRILWGPATTGVASGTFDNEGALRIYDLLVPRMDRLGSGSTFPTLGAGTNTGILNGGTLAPSTTAYWRDAFS